VRRKRRCADALPVKEMNEKKVSSVSTGFLYLMHGREGTEGAAYITESVPRHMKI